MSCAAYARPSAYREQCRWPVSHVPTCRVYKDICATHRHRCPTYTRLHVGICFCDSCIGVETGGTRGPNILSGGAPIHFDPKYLLESRASLQDKHVRARTPVQVQQLRILCSQPPTCPPPAPNIQQLPTPTKDLQTDVNTCGAIPQILNRSLQTASQKSRNRPGL